MKEVDIASIVLLSTFVSLSLVLILYDYLADHRRECHPRYSKGLNSGPLTSDNIGSTFFGASRTYSVVQSVFCFFLILAFGGLLLIDRRGYVLLSSFAAGAIVLLIISLICLLIVRRYNFKSLYAAVSGYTEPCKVALGGGYIAGVVFVSLGLVSVVCGVIIFYTTKLFDPKDIGEATELFSGFALGTCFTGFFVRVSGGLFVGASGFAAEFGEGVFSGQVYKSQISPACVSYNVGVNVGNSTGFCTDLISSLCTVLCCFVILFGRLKYDGDKVISGTFGYLVFPMLVIALSVFISSVVTFLVKRFHSTRDGTKALRALGLIIFSSALLVCLFLPALARAGFPQKISSLYGYSGFKLLGSLGLGILTGLVLLFSSYLSSYFIKRDAPGVDAVSSQLAALQASSSHCMRVLVPLILLVFNIIFAKKLLGAYGIAFAAVGLLSMVSVCIVVALFGFVSHSASEMSEIADFGSEVASRVEALKCAGGVAETMASDLTSFMSYFVALVVLNTIFVLKNAEKVLLHDGYTHGGLLIGACAPFLFFAFLMKGLSSSAAMTHKECLRQCDSVESGESIPDYKKCIRELQFSCCASVVFPLLIICTIPVLVGISLGRNAVIGCMVGIHVAAFFMNVPGSISCTWARGGVASRCGRGSLGSRNLDWSFFNDVGCGLGSAVKLATMVILVGFQSVVLDFSNKSGGPAWIG